MTTETSKTTPSYGFFTDLARILNAGQSRSVLLGGNVHDLYYVGDDENGDYHTLIQFLVGKCAVPGLMLLVYELNGPVRTAEEADRDKLRDAWVSWKTGTDREQLILSSLSSKRKQRERELIEEDFDRRVRQAIGKPTLALEFLRQLALCSRSKTPKGKPHLDETLLIIIEGADMLLPAGNGDISHLSAADRHRVTITADWFSDPGFMAGDDSVVLLTESRSLVHPRVSRLPQVLSVEVGAPDSAAREHYIQWFHAQCQKDGTTPPQLWGSAADLARFTAGLSIHALRQLLIGASHSGSVLEAADVIGKVEEFICSQLGEDVVEFKKPEHTLNDVIGFSRLKAFIGNELLPRFRSTGKDALPGAAVAGPIGGGKTFIFEAVAGALDLPVLVLKNIRSQWFGQTDVIFERLRRVLEALDKVVIFVDEADTQFGGVGPGEHATERRLTGKIQAMMSDPRLRGRIVWLLMTARIHLLSPDIRRPGRVGDLIIPILDPTGDDRAAFVRWVLAGVRGEKPSQEEVDRLDGLTRGYSAAAFASLRSQLQSRASGSPSIEAIEEIVRDHIPPAIEDTRRYQTLQALINCTRRSLLPDPDISDEQRKTWQEEVRRLEALGIR